jgi:hypothetical protein
MSAGGRLCTLQENPHFWVPTIKVRPPDGTRVSLLLKFFQDDDVDIVSIDRPSRPSSNTHRGRHKSHYDYSSPGSSPEGRGGRDRNDLTPYRSAVVSTISTMNVFTILALPYI